jgi:hypothetical protein
VPNLPRPLTHDTLAHALVTLDARIERIVVGYDPATSVFAADVVLALADGDERHLDRRVSDAVAVAVRAAPRPMILIPDSLLSAPPPPPTVDRTVHAETPRIRLKCHCGTEMTLDASALFSEGTAESATIACPACRRELTVKRPD